MAGKRCKVDSRYDAGFEFGRSEVAVKAGVWL